MTGSSPEATHTAPPPSTDEVSGSAPTSDPPQTPDPVATGSPEAPSVAPTSPAVVSTPTEVVATQNKSQAQIAAEPPKTAAVVTPAATSPAQPVVRPNSGADANPVITEHVTQSPKTVLALSNTATHTVQTLAVTPTTSAVPATAPPTDFLSALVSTAAAIFGVSPQSNVLGPQTPTSPFGSLLELVFVGLRRIGGLVANSGPTLTSGTTTQVGNGLVTGQLVGTDPDGDALTLKVSQGPTKGSVILNSEGSYVYEAGAALAATGGTDTFYVSADDGHRSLVTVGPKGVDLSLFGRAGTTTVPVTVTVAAGTENPPSNASTTFTVVNLSSVPVLYRGISQVDGDVSRPRPGTILQPGDAISFDLTRYVVSRSSATAEFGDPNQPGYSVNMWAQSLVVGGYTISCTAGGGKSCSSTTDDRLYLLDPKGTVVNVPSDPRQSADTMQFLDKVCGAGGGATSCKFAMSREEKTYSDPTLVDFVRNGTSTDLPFDRTFSTTFTQSISSSVTGKVATNLTKILAAEVSATSGRTDSTSQQFTQVIRGVAAPGETVDVYSQSPVYRDYGTLTAVVGNTTYVARDIYLDSPRTDGYNRWTLKNRPKTATDSASGGTGDTGTGQPTVPVAVQSAAVSVSPLQGVLDTFAAIGRQLIFGGNVAPTATAGSPMQLSRGVVVGVVNATDVNGDPLTYQVSEAPTRGTVTLDGSGNYEYTPDASLLVAGGVDTFAVTVDDGHYGPTGRTVVPVSVTVAQVGVGTAASQSFQVVNNTHYDLIYTGASGTGTNQLDRAPAKGTVFTPGSVAQFDIGIVILGSSDHPVVADFVAATGERFSANLVSNDLGVKKVSCGLHDGGTCSTGGNSTVTFLDNPGTAINVVPSQAANLVNLCGTVECVVKLPPKVDRPIVEGPGTPNGAAVTNLTNRPAFSTIVVSKTVSQTDSANVNVKASSNLLKFVDVEFSANYGESFTAAQTYSGSETVSVPIGGTVYGYVQPLLRRTVADFTVYLGNTTYTIKGVVLDTPQKGGGVTYKEGEPPLA